MAEVPSLRSIKRKFRTESLIHDLEIRDLIQRALAFQSQVAAAKARLAPAEFGWYPWDSFGTLSLLDPLLTGRARFLRSMTGGEPILDVGCADGDLSFLFESLGYDVHAVDNPPTNFNGMRGVRAMKAHLRSSVRIEEADLDSRFQLPPRRFGLALFFGILYHLKNPLGALEALSTRARYCLLSTAIARFTPDRKVDMQTSPLAYLAGRDGLKGDETNYWIFSEAGLRVLVDRAGWEVRDWMVTGDTGATLWGAEPDERVFCLLRSRAMEEVPRTQLYAGWHMLENDSWRWTQRRFSLAVEKRATLKLKLTIPEFLPVPLTLACGPHQQTFVKAGDYDFICGVDPGIVEFELDRALEPSAEDGRERGIVVREVELSD